MYRNTRSGQVVGVLKDFHTEEVTQVVFHPHSPSLLFSASEDGVTMQRAFAPQWRLPADVRLLL
jgi:hypothetical protein